MITGDWQNLVALLLVGWAVLFLLHRARLVLATAVGSGCAGGCAGRPSARADSAAVSSCAATSPASLPAAPRIIPIEQLVISARELRS